jgi:hypothetical protein
MEQESEPAPTQAPITDDQLTAYLNQMAEKSDLLKTQVLPWLFAFDVVLGKLRAVEQENRELKQAAEKQRTQRPEGSPVLGASVLESEVGGNNGAHSRAGV